MKKKKTENIRYVYEVEYASGMLRNNGRQNQFIISSKELNDGDFIIVEHIDCGIFIGRVKGLMLAKSTDKELFEKFFNCNIEDCEYRYIKNIDVSEWYSKIQRQKRMEELQYEMEIRFDEIDKKKKYEYYAKNDDEFRDLYLEYTELESQNEKGD